MKIIAFGWVSLGLLIWPGILGADWPTVRGNAERTGYVAASLQPRFRVAWGRAFEGERLGTAMEPIVAGGLVFAATHRGNLYALKAESGEAVWRFAAAGPFLHSPAAAGGLVIAGCADGRLYALEAASGRLAWQHGVEPGGFSASPAVEEDRIFIGTREGDFLGLELKTAKVLWRQRLGVPIRQTAAVADGRVFVTGEDLRVRCFKADTGEILWTSAQLAGQTARDYYPVIVRRGDRRFVIVRTNPILNMGQRIGRDRTMLCRNAGVDDSTWQKVDAWIKSDQARGKPELWSGEQEAIKGYLETNRDARTFFVLDATTGKEAFTAPVLWIAGCQGVGAEPALTADGQLLVFYRSAYGNWNHGVAPLVALGLLDLEANRITPLFHEQGRQPPWNTFWGTADESQNFVVVGDLALIVHQGTLSGFDLKTRRLFAIAGERDTYGGLRNPSWARNEWHGPARSGVAVVGDRIYWQTGSRVLCLVASEPGKAGAPRSISAGQVPAAPALPEARLGREKIQAALSSTVGEILSQAWAPLFVDPGLAGRDFSFDDSGELFEALAWAYPWLPTNLQIRAKAQLSEAWEKHPPFTREGWYSLKEGARRELFWVPEEFCARLGGDKQPHPFGNVYGAWLYGQRCGEQPKVLEAWPKLKTAFADFTKTGWRLDGRGDLYANRYLASLLAMEKLAGEAQDSEVARQAKDKAAETAEGLAAWWTRAAGGNTLREFKGAGELDPFIGAGDAISFKVAPHRHKLALFLDLTPEVAGLIRAKAPEAVERVWRVFEGLYATWPLMGEERQVHFGENFVDPPDLALGAFKALAWLRPFGGGQDLAGKIDIPFCRADLYYVTKLALVLETGAAQ